MHAILRQCTLTCTALGRSMFFRLRRIKAGVSDGLELIGVDDGYEALRYLAALVAHFKFGVETLEGQVPVDGEKLAVLTASILQRVPDTKLDEVVEAFGRLIKERYAGP